ncbi:MAG: hypothetical protein WKF76_01110 [Nocardioidaceae bacterium]
MPDAATMATGPGRTTLAKPSPTPPTTAVPQSGPITSSPLSAAISFSATSCSTATLSLKTITSSPAPSASAASIAATAPGVLMSASRAGDRRAAARMVGGGTSVLAAAGRRCGHQRGLQHAQRLGHGIVIGCLDGDQHVVR